MKRAETFGYDYRVIDEGDQFSVHKIYYNHAGEIVGIADVSSIPEAVTIDLLKVQVELMIKSFEKPVLKLDEIVNVD